MGLLIHKSLNAYKIDLPGSSNNILCTKILTKNNHMYNINFTALMIQQKRKKK